MAVTITDTQLVKYAQPYQVGDETKKGWQIAGRLVPYKNGTPGFNIYLTHVPMTYDKVGGIMVPARLATYYPNDKANAPAEVEIETPFGGDENG